MERFKAELKAYAKEIGFDSIGIAAPSVFDLERLRLAHRAQTMGANPFELQDIDARVEPERQLKGVGAIIAVSMSYLMADAPAQEPLPKLHGWLSRYCRGLDYHTLMEERLHLLEAFIQTRMPQERCFAHVDVGAPLDRAIAERAGLGKFGKNTNIIAPKLGSWVFLGELYTTLPLPPDAPATWNACGTCTRCLDACPTQALTEWNLDWHRCLGYLNQMDGAIPEAFRAVMADRLFGCDDCQDVCPYNRTALKDLHPEFAPLPGLENGPDLIALLGFSQAQFEDLFAPTAAAWRGLETLQRNAIIALGNSTERAAFAPLQTALSHKSPLLRSHAAWALGRLASQLPVFRHDAERALMTRRSEETDSHVMSEIERALLCLQNLANPQ